MLKLIFSTHEAAVMKNRKKSSLEKTPRDETGQFRRGTSGNPQGRPKGSRNRTTMAAMSLLDSEAEMITQRAIEAARDGDLSALKLVMDRIIPPRRRPMIQLDLAELDTIRDAAEAHRRVIQAALDGGLSLDEAERLCKLIEDNVQVWDIGEYDWRVQRYLRALFRRLENQRNRWKKISEKDAKGAGAEPDKIDPSQLPKDPSLDPSQLPKDRSLATTLYLAALAYEYDCRDHRYNIDRAWSDLPLSEREWVRQASEYFPWCEIPEQ
jgi:hypothetical protein